MNRKKFLVIVDPWIVPPPEDAIKFPMLASDSKIQYQLIYNQLSRLKPLFDDIIVDDTGYTSHSIFEELPRVDNVLEGYLEDKQDWDMWLCGFHYGRCIHGKIRGVVENFEWDYSRFHIIQNLSFMLPGDQIVNTLGPGEMSLAPADWQQNIEIFKNVKEYQWDYIGKFIELNEK
jgi:hypothetical protein|tara:strand:- start:178 stop:702 length:525 start_codon:yes stop_codon:yes gene_type:complete